MVSREAQQSSEGSQNFTAKKGAIGERYTQPFEIGFSVAVVAEARRKKALLGQTVVVVGANYNGIGGATAREAALQGANIVFTTTPKEDTCEERALEDELHQLGSERVSYVPMNIIKPKDRTNLIDRVVEEYGRIDGLVIATGVTPDDFFMRFKPKDYRRAFEINYFGPAFLTQSVSEHMQRKQKNPKGGRIVLLSSVSAVGNPGQAEYGPPKAGLDTLVKVVAGEGLYRDVSFSAVSPGLVDTRMTKDLKDEHQEFLRDLTSADRNLLPQEVAELNVFLLNPNISANGAVVPIFGLGEMPVPNGNKLIHR